MTKEAGQFELLRLVNTSRRQTRAAIIALAAICAVLSVGIIIVANKPPLVIRIDRIGNTEAVKDYTVETAIPQDEDIKNFVTVFMSNYYGLRSDYVVPQLEKSVNMMTRSYRDTHMSAFEKNQTISKIQNANIMAEVKLKDQISYEIFGDDVQVKIAGEILRRSLDDDAVAPERKVFSALLVLKKVPRTPQEPFGLLVDNVMMTFDDKALRIDKTLTGVTHEDK
ncbi:MAG: hypothetical protein HQM16_18510 [Deltaproteobacteria bacterium]|nr:hypothetical protein [Deltaproteobacteria bacterium]